MGDPQRVTLQFRRALAILISTFAQTLDSLRFASKIQKAEDRKKKENDIQVGYYKHSHKKDGESVF